MNWHEQIGWASGVALAAMVVLWAVQIVTKKVALVDVGWSVLIGGSFVFYAATGDGDVTRRWIAAAMGGLWGARLGLHMLLDRVLTTHEDGRYKQWREEFGAAKFQKVMLAFFVAQAVTVPVLAAPHLINAHNPAAVGVLDWLAVAVWVTGFFGVSVADSQLKKFKNDPANKKKVCDVGLWRYSRHPNYFFEWLMWVGYGLLATSGPVGWLGWSAALVMLLLITKVSGIPPAEKQSLRSRGDAYQRYQARTSAFVPLPPKKMEGAV